MGALEGGHVRAVDLAGLGREGGEESIVVGGHVARAGRLRDVGVVELAFLIFEPVAAAVEVALLVFDTADLGPGHRGGHQCAARATHQVVGREGLQVFGAAPAPRPITHHGDFI